MAAKIKDGRQIQDGRQITWILALYATFLLLFIWCWSDSLLLSYTSFCVVLCFFTAKMCQIFCGLFLIEPIREVFTKKGYFSDTVLPITRLIFIRFWQTFFCSVSGDELSKIGRRKQTSIYINFFTVLPNNMPTYC